MLRYVATSRGDIIAQLATNTVENANRDPLPTDDKDGSYDIGTLWYNQQPGELRVWQCMDSTKGAARWAYMGCDYVGGGTDPPSAPSGGGGGLTQAQADIRYVNTAGDTMTGLLVLSGPPTLPLHAATKAYVDALPVSAPPDLSPYLLLAGGTMTGPLVLPGDPTADLQAATKAYVDETDAALELLKVDRAGDTMTGPLSIDSATSAELIFSQNGVKRWVIRKDNSAETGANAGSDLSFDSYDDAGNFIQTEFMIPRGAAGFVVTTGTHQFNGGIRIPNSRTAIFSSSGTGALSNRIFQAADSAMSLVCELIAVQDGLGHGTFEIRNNNAAGGLVVSSSITGDLLAVYDVYARGVKLAGITYVDAQDALSVLKAGDTMTGPLVLPATAPTLPQQATNKDYVDTAIANSQLNQGTWQVATNTPDLITAVPTNLNGYTWTAQTVDPNVGEVAPGAIPGVGGSTINAGDTIRWNSTLATYEQIQGAGLTQAVADGRYVNVAGDTMAGVFILAADPLTDPEAATKRYVDAADAVATAALALKVNKTGDTMTGPLVLPDNPLPTQAANRNYVDQMLTAVMAMKVNKAGDTMTGLLILSANPSAALGAVTKQYADTADSQRVLKAGDTMTGALVLPGDPVAALDASPKQYVDAQSALHVLKAGDTLTGPLVLAADPANPLEASTKAYVDAEVASANLYQGTWQVTANTPDLDPAVASPLNGYSWIAVTTDPNVAETAPAGLPGIGGSLIFNGDTIKWNAAGSIYEQIQGGSLTIAQADARYVVVTGDTMTGNLVLPGVQTDWLWPSTDGHLQIRGDGTSGPGQLRQIDLYATYTDPVSYVRAEYFIDAAAQVVDFGGVYVNGAGYANYNLMLGPRGGGQLVLRTSDTAWWSVMPTGQLYAVTDNTTDIGNATAFRPRDIHVARDIRLGGVIDMLETATTPANPATGRLRLYPKDDGNFYKLDAAGVETIIGAGGGGGGLDQAAADLLYLKLAGGGVMTAGDITLFRAPAQPLHAATKNYVDSAVASQSLYQGNWAVATNVPDLRPVAANPLNGWSWTAVTLDPQVPENAPATIPGIAGQSIYNGDKITWNTALGVYERVQGSSLTGPQASALFVDVAGDSMTGPLILSGDPGTPLQAATKRYVDLMVPLLGATMTGLLLLSADPVDVLGAATKGYVDQLADNAVQKVGDVMTGNLALPLNPGPTNPEDATTKDYVDRSLAASSLYQGAWQVAANTPDLTAATPLNGYSWIAQTADPNIPEAAPAGLPGITAGTLIGAGTTIRWNGNTLAWELIQGGGLTQAVAGTLYVAKTGDTMTGNLTIQNDGQGVLFLGGGRFYKKVGTGLVIRAHTANTQPQIENNDGSNARDIIDTINGDARYVNTSGDTMTGVLHIGAATGLVFDTVQAANPGDNSKHIILYSTAPTIGINVTSGRINYNHNAAGDTHWFRTGNTDRLGISDSITFSAPVDPGMTVTGANGAIALVLQSTTNANGNNLPAIEFRSSDGRAGSKLYSVQMTTAVQYGGHENNFTAYQFCGGFSYVRLWWGSVASPPNFNLQGDCYARGVKLTSDPSLKERIRPVDADEVSRAFAALKPVRYHWKPQTTYNPLSPDGRVAMPDFSPDRMEWGFLADDLEAVDPDLVSIQDRTERMDSDGQPIDNPPTQEVKHYDLAAVVAIAVAKIAALEAEIADLKGRLA